MPFESLTGVSPVDLFNLAADAAHAIPCRERSLKMVELVTLAVLALASAGVSADSVEWQSDYGKALEASRSEARPLLIVLDKDSAEPDQLAAEGDQEELLGAYECCHVDVSTAYGKKVASAFKAKEFPFAAIIDKTGSVVLTKKTGEVTDEEWQSTLTTYKSGERKTKAMQTSFFRGGEVTSSVQSPSYCPSCQRKAQGL
jgi:hypothetical protein